MMSVGGGAPPSADFQRTVDYEIALGKKKTSKSSGASNGTVRLKGWLESHGDSRTRVEGLPALVSADSLLPDLALAAEGDRG